MGTPFLHKMPREVVIFKGFSKKIKSGVVLGQNLGQLRSNVMKKVTKQVVKSPAWKFMAIIGRNAEGQISARFGSKMAKN